MLIIQRFLLVDRTFSLWCIQKSEANYNFCRSVIGSVPQGIKHSWAVLTIAAFTTIAAAMLLPPEVSFRAALPILRASMNFPMFTFATLHAQENRNLSIDEAVDSDVKVRNLFPRWNFGVDPVFKISCPVIDHTAVEKRYLKH